jgi:Cu(I)/Ag(I) efflux system membrane fusion protein
MKTGQGARPLSLSEEAGHRIGITFAVATEESLEREIRAVGQIVYDETRVKVVAPKLEGWVERLYVNESGQEVRAGDRIMDVYSPMIVAAEDELLLAARLERDLSPADSGVRANATLLVAGARARLAAWDLASDDIARIELAGRPERTVTVRSPASGFVVEKNIVQGQRVMAGDQLYKIVDLRQVWLEGEVYEQDLNMLHVGQRASAEIQALPDATFNGTVSYIYPTLNVETRTARIRIRLSNPALRLKPGMGATLRLHSTGIQRMLTVPRSAVLATGERRLVFMKRADGRLEPREVRVGPATEQRIAILSGLVRGDTVVASATFLVDAEANLGAALGGMGDMPGMDIAPPRKKE